ncbi:glycosyltransferase family 1 protein [Leptolyngbya sp. FACHB-261]|uniref:glycosyltransferase family 4 protein n=1 Tax=Leptolyngbya sp. FACHB-261 TaxID=2692806 RepID=UPI00168A16C3|nr:glycosyltransferase family 1 protein [Leptolyngbya sp. FACHB-261]MBD2099627.1 glycosyltransferase family 4 protein [Leptolyngbya sp. FACHB-261]
MRILYDGQIYAIQFAGGVNRYFANLISRLPEDYTPLLTTCQNREVNYPTHPNLKVFFYKRFGFRPGRLSYWLEKYYFRSVTNFGRYEVFHPTYYSLLTQQNFDTVKRPIVVTVYDMIHELFAKQTDPDGHQIEEKRQAVLAAQAIICISENTKKDLLERYPALEDRVTVTYLATDMNVSLAYGTEAVPTRPYYLYVGSRYNYKNFDRILMALAKAISIRPELMLCVVGPAFNDEEKQLVATLNLAHAIEHYNYADDRHLAKLYRCSLALVYPSLYEGFGIPPLEAMSCRTAVVASNCSSIPEVVGDAGILFGPNSITDLADILIDLSENPTKRDELIAKGEKRATMFSWEKTAAQTLAVYQAISNK